MSYTITTSALAFSATNAVLRAEAAAGNAVAQAEIDRRAAKQQKLASEGKLGKLRSTALGAGIAPTRVPKSERKPAAAPKARKTAEPKPVAAFTRTKERITVAKLAPRVEALETGFVQLAKLSATTAQIVARMEERLAARGITA